MPDKYDLSDVLCKCGCGTPLGVVSKPTYYRIKGGYANAGWIKGHHATGERNVHWNNRQAISANGYRMVWCPDHPNANRAGWILEHRLIMAEHLGRALAEGEVVHHRNEDKLDNRIDNLQLLTAATHRLEHDPNASRRVPRTGKTCAACGATFTKPLIGNHRRAKFCSLACRNSAGEHAARRKLTLEDERAIRADAATPTATLAARYGVSLTTIKRLRRKPR